jgi:hypothetical protein
MTEFSTNNLFSKIVTCLAFASMGLVLSSCAKAGSFQTSDASASASLGVPPANEVPPATGGSSEPAPSSTPGVVAIVAPLAWESGHPERAAWSAELRRQFTAALSSFDQASDTSAYCTRYAELSVDQRVAVWATMAVAIAKYESAYNPASIAPCDANCTASIGLYQLSYEDQMSWCAMNKAAGNLIDPIVNIRCAVPEMQRLVARDGVVASGWTVKSSAKVPAAARGLSRYWSTMWNSSNSNGKSAAIQTATQSLAFCH